MMKKKLGKVKVKSMNGRLDDIPEDWDKLREEARNAIENGIEVDNSILGIYSTDFTEIKL